MEFAAVVGRLDSPWAYCNGAVKSNLIYLGGFTVNMRLGWMPSDERRNN